ncbi:MAG TPA: DUF4159 domain-containing protein [Opitutaceae bacterium]|nr:DUF4159 domain-containing protein [Opitutaceae bacterium]
MKRLVPTISLFLVLTVMVMAQRRFGGRGGGGWGWGESYVSDDAKTAREVPSHSTGTPVWTNPHGFEKDVFTFVRVKRGRAPYAPGGRWSTDTPDSDLNLSYRLQQMTSLRVDPDGRFIWLTDPDLTDYPFIYMVEPGSLYLTDEEIAALRKYLLNGGFLMLDDFWGDTEWENAAQVIKKVLPERSFVELPLDHPVYHCVFEIKVKGQVPNVGLGEASEFDPEHRTWEPNHDGDTRTVHHRAIFDDKGRMMVIATHNTDNGDGWEREGESDYYFHNFSEKIAYPLGINIIFYAMTH